MGRGGCLRLRGCGKYRRDEGSSVALLLHALRNIHPLMKNPDDVNQSGVSEAIEQEMGSDGELRVPGADVVDGATCHAPVCQPLASGRECPNVAFGLIDTPAAGRVVPDFGEVGAGSRSRLSPTKRSTSKGVDGPLSSPATRAARRVSSLSSCSSSRRKPARTTSLAEP